MSNRMSDFSQWLNVKSQKMKWYDVGFVKMSVMGFTLLIAKVWPPILALDWWWYGVIFLVFYFLAVYRVYWTPDS